MISQSQETVEDASSTYMSALTALGAVSIMNVGRVAYDLYQNKESKTY